MGSETTQPDHDDQTYDSHPGNEPMRPATSAFCSKQRGGSHVKGHQFTQRVCLGISGWRHDGSIYGAASLARNSRRWGLQPHVKLVIQEGQRAASERRAELEAQFAQQAIPKAAATPVV